MNNLKMDNKSLIENYQPTPNMYYDVEGKVKGNNGKTIKIEKSMNDQIVEYTIRVKKEMNVRAGEIVKVGKDNIRSIEIDKKEEEKVYSEEETRDIGKILRDLGLEYSEENIKMIDSLISSGIKPTKNNIDSYKISKEILGEIIEEIDTESIIKILDNGMDLEEASLEEVSELLREVKNGKDGYSIQEFLKIERDLSYKDAENISKEIYGQKMGRDVYDIIIALDKEKLPINKEIIDKAVDVLSKINDLKSVEDKSFVQILNKEMDFTINNLFKLKNDYTIDNIDTNRLSRRFEEFNLIGEASIDSLRQVLSEIGLEDTEENLSIGREFILQDMDIHIEDHIRVIEMKEKVEQLKISLTDESLIKLLERDVNILEEDIEDLIDVLENMDILEGIEEREITNDFDREIIDSIEDKDLLMLIREGKDFNLKNIKEIKTTDIKNDLSLDFRVLDRTIEISNIFNTIGEKPKLEAVNLAGSRSEQVTLDELYRSQLDLKSSNIQVENISKTREDLILNEYLKSRNDMTINIIKESIKDGSDIDFMPLTELNSYIEKKINRYREVDDLAKDLKGIRVNKDRIIPLVIKNDLNMTLKEIKDINSYLKGEEGISKNISEIFKNTNANYSEKYKEEIKGLQKHISDSVKNGNMSIKEDYKNLINILSGNNSGFDSKGDSGENNKFIEVQRKLSKKDIVFQLPVEIDGQFKDLSIIIPETGKEIDRNNMSFSVSLETDNLGLIEMNLKVVGRDVSVYIKEDENKLESEIGYLKEYLGDIGYNLEFIRER